MRRNGLLSPIRTPKATGNRANRPMKLNNERGGPPLRDRWFADSPLEESGFEPLVPPQSQHNRRTGPARCRDENARCSGSSRLDPPRVFARPPVIPHRNGTPPESEIRLDLSSHCPEGGVPIGTPPNVFLKFNINYLCGIGVGSSFYADSHLRQHVAKRRTRIGSRVHSSRHRRSADLLADQYLMRLVTWCADAH
jgi:hypothetical protein